jgi:hypothetical protein
MRSDRRLKKYYRIINKKFFAGELPNDVCVRYADSDDTDDDEKCEEIYFGWADKCNDGYHKYQIAISRIKNPGITAVLATLLHECIHIRTSLRDDHGLVFEQWRKTVGERGAFRKGSLLPGLTIF